MPRLVRFLVSLVGVALAVGIVMLVDSLNLMRELPSTARVVIYMGAGFIGFLITFLLAQKWIEKLQRSLESFARRMETIPLTDIIFGTIGLLIGLIIAGLVSNPILQLSMSYLGNFVGVAISVVIYLLLGILGIRLAIRSKDEILQGLDSFKEDLFNRSEKSQEKKSEKLKRRFRKSRDEEGAVPEIPTAGGKKPKILDTSVIIDGRIFEVISVGFLEGPFIISNYVLEELQHISDSADGLRRERGRKGLDNIADLQKNRPQDVIVDNQIIEEAKEVDAKLLILTNIYEGKIVTNDYNLNKVATVQNIPVLNVNDLANALKPIVIPGELMEVNIIKEGKEPEQGLGYLDDGTMIVVENGHEFIGQSVLTIVTSVLQTSAGKMIFTRIQE